MDAVTYPTDNVVHFVNNYLIPLRINVSEELRYENFLHFWTPTLIVLDQNGNELQRTIGFLDPDEFLASMHLGLAKARLVTGNFDTAIIPLKSLLETFPKSCAVPEAIYYSGVTLYKQSNDPGKLKEAYEKLLSNYPDSQWTKRASPYDLI